jgi:ABC-type nitrate/sulfonate/bicarbonate transport system permease component
MKNLKIIDKTKENILPVIFILTIIIIWQFVVEFKNIPQYLIPTPLDIIEVFKEDFNTLKDHTLVTIYEGVVGFILAVIFAFLLGIIMDFFTIIKRCLYPILVISQTVPTITIAPLLIIWFGFGLLPKVIVVMITCFFPIVINFVDGLEKVDKDYINLFKTMKASRWQIFSHLKLPMAMNNFFSGIKISVTYMIMAATIGEWLGGDKGLGVYMLRAKSAYALDKVFASTIIVVFISIMFVLLAEILKKIFVYWNEE